MNKMLSEYLGHHGKLVAHGAFNTLKIASASEYAIIDGKWYFLRWTMRGNVLMSVDGRVVAGLVKKYGSQHKFKEYKAAHSNQKFPIDAQYI